MKYLIPVLLLLALAIPTARSAEGDVLLPLCSQTVHDKHTWTGPDGASYPTWHPQIDAQNGCHFDHEHGSSPALFTPSTRKFGGAGALWPVYGYAGAQMGMTEPHVGFKTYVFDDLAGHTWMLSNHFGTANAVGAACNRYHSVDIAVKDNASGALLVDTYFMGDFGKSVDNVSGAALTPPGCPTQGNITGTAGTRRMIVQSSGAVAYEPWTYDLPGNVLGYSSALLSINTPSAQTICNDLTCSANVATENNGAFRFLKLNVGVGWSTGVYSGTFYTDAHATTVLSATDPGAVRQFVAPGVSISLPLLVCKTYDAQTYIMGCAGLLDDQDMFKFNPFVTGAN